MTIYYRYMLEPYSGYASRFDCPMCNAKATFTRYIDNETNEYVSPECGRCNRLAECGEHLPPHEYFKKQRHALTTAPRPPKQVTIRPAKKNSRYDLIPEHYVKRSLGSYGKNTFVQFLHSMFTLAEIRDICNKYMLGTVRKSTYAGCVVFWQKCEKGNIRTGKFMRYTSLGKRSKENYGMNWFHTFTLAGIAKPFSLQQAFFGEHLLKKEEFASLPVAVVESEKTACIMSVVDDSYLWLATGSVNNLRGMYSRCEVLKQRTTVLFPDKGMEETWGRTAADLQEKFQSEIIMDVSLNDEVGIYSGDDIADVHIPILQADKAEYEEQAFSSMEIA